MMWIYLGVLELWTCVSNVGWSEAWIYIFGHMPSKATDVLIWHQFGPFAPTAGGFMHPSTDSTLETVAFWPFCRCRPF